MPNIASDQSHSSSPTVDPQEQPQFNSNDMLPTTPEAQPKGLNGLIFLLCLFDFVCEHVSSVISPNPHIHPFYVASFSVLSSQYKHIINLIS